MDLEPTNSPPTVAATSQPYSEAPRPSLLKRFLKGILPLVLIALAVYLVFNGPAIWLRLTYLLSNPDSASAATLPGVVYGQGQSYGSGGYPNCQGNIPYDKNGKPKRICNNYIYISKIRVAAPIVRPTSTAESVINDALLNGVVQYPGTANPGERGNVFLTGHSSYYWWVKTDYRNVFALQPELRPGDLIVIYYNQRRYLYKTSATYEVSPTQTGVLKPTPTPILTLSTCVPVGTSYRRKIVQAKQISPDPATARVTSGQAAAPGRLPGVR